MCAKPSAACILGNDGFDEGLDDGRVEVQTSLILQLDNSISMGFLPMLRAGIYVTVVVIGDGDNARADRNVLSLEALGIACAVPLLMVAADNVADNRKAGNIFQHTGAGDAVALIDGLLACRQKGQLVQDDIGHRKLADVMQERRRFNQRNLGGRQAQLGCCAGCVVGDLLAVQTDFVIFYFQHFHVELADFLRHACICKVQTLRNSNHNSVSFVSVQIKVLIV